MQAFHGKEDIKTTHLKRLQEHKDAGEIYQADSPDDEHIDNDLYGAVRLTVHSRDHREYERQLGIPKILADIEDSIFDQISPTEAVDWPETFLEAIKVGADLSGVWPKFAHWLLVDPTFGIVNFVSGANKSRPIIQRIADLYSNEEKQKIKWLEAKRSAQWEVWSPRYRLRALADLLIPRTFNKSLYVEMTAFEAACSAAASGYKGDEEAKWAHIYFTRAHIYNYVPDYSAPWEKYVEANRRIGNAKAEKLLELLRAA